MLLKKCDTNYIEYNVDIEEGSVCDKEYLKKFVSKIFKDSPNEKLLIIVVDSNNVPKGYYEIGATSEDEIVFSVSTIIRNVLLTGYNRFLLVHNHPDNSDKVSYEDYISYKEIKEISEYLGLEYIGDYVCSEGKLISCEEYNDDDIANFSFDLSIKKKTFIYFLILIYLILLLMYIMKGVL